MASWVNSSRSASDGSYPFGSRSSSCCKIYRITSAYARGWAVPASNGAKERRFLRARAARNQLLAAHRLEAHFHTADQAVERDRLAQIVELAGLDTGDIRAGRQGIEPAGDLISQRHTKHARFVLPPHAQFGLQNGH